MENIKIKKISDGRKCKYLSEFNKPGTIRNIVKYLKTNESPSKLNNGISVISVSEINDNEIKRVMTSPLPNTSIVSNILGNLEIHVTYDIAYSDEILVSKASNPPIIDNYFKFKEQLIIEENNGILNFKREAIIFNTGKQIPLIGDSFQEYDDFFNTNTLLYYWYLGEIADD